MILDNVPRPMPGATQGASAHQADLLAQLIAQGRLRPDIGVTTRGRDDGAGQQAIAIIKAMMLARYAGCRYFHSPFETMAHAEGPPQEWAARWERFFNFGDGEAPVPADAELVRLSAALADPAAFAARPVVICQRLFGLPKQAVPAGEALRAELRARYWRSPKSAILSHRGRDGITVAVHVRRGDITASMRRYVPDEAVLRNIACLKRALAPFGRALTFNLYSEGAATDYRLFAQAGCALHISEDHFETLHNLVTADILLGSPSNFSYVAGFLTQGIVLDHRRRVPKFHDWLGRKATGEIAVKQLRRALLRRMGWRERCGVTLRRWLGA